MPPKRALFRLPNWLILGLGMLIAWYSGVTHGINVERARWVNSDLMIIDHPKEFTEHRSWP